MLFLSGWDSGLVSLRRVRYRLVWPFSISVDSPRNQRGRSCSRNGGLGFEIRADNRRFRDPKFSPPTSRVMRSNALIPASFPIENLPSGPSLPKQTTVHIPAVLYSITPSHFFLCD